MTDAQPPNPPNAQTQNALIVFAKPPAPGEVKTRLTPVLTPEEAAQLYAAFLRDALDQYTALGATIRLYWSTPVPGDFDDFVPASVDEFLQRGGNLGARMQHAFRETLAAGFDRAVIIGTDHPTLPTPFIQQAFSTLQEPKSVCIGPSADGGYYLLGMNAFYPQPFEGMQYSHADVFDQTLDRIGQTDAACTVLPRWYDVDTPEALRQLIRDLEASAVETPNTRAAIEALGLRRRLAADSA